MIHPIADDNVSHNREITTVLCDDRWSGDSGIGRYYREITSRVPPDVRLRRLSSRFAIRDPLSPLRLSADIRRVCPDVFWSPGFLPPARTRVPFIVTMHDLTHLKYASVFHRFYYNNIIRPLVARAAQIVTVSNYSRRELLKWLEVDERRVVAIPNGVSSSFEREGESLNLTGPYFLYAGNRRAHKNVPRLLESFSSADCPGDVMLAMTGESDPEIEALAKSLRIYKRLIFLGRPSDEDLARAYRGALAVVQVSLEEGFGLPVVEAMACGAPVIVSDIGAFREIVDTAGIIVDPLDVKEMARALSELSKSRALRYRLAEQGIERARLYSWAEASARTWDVIKGVAGR